MQHPLILRIVLLCFALSGLASAADVFVYKGTVKTRGSLSVSNAIPPLVRIYFVVDFETGEARGIVYFNRGGKKQTSNDVAFNVTRAALANAKSATVIGYGNHSGTSVNQFNFVSVVLQGTDVSLKIETQPAARTVIRPRTFIGKGIGTSSATGVDGNFQFSNYNMVLQPALTIDANNNNKTIETVYEEISAALLAQGYELP